MCDWNSHSKRLRFSTEIHIVKTMKKHIAATIGRMELERCRRATRTRCLIRETNNRADWNVICNKFITAHIVLLLIIYLDTHKNEASCSLSLLYRLRVCVSVSSSTCFLISTTVLFHFDLLFCLLLSFSSSFRVRACFAKARVFVNAVCVQ